MGKYWTEHMLGYFDLACYTLTHLLVFILTWCWVSQLDIQYFLLNNKNIF